MVKYFFLFSLFFIAGCEFRYHDRYVVFPDGKVKGDTFVIADTDKKLVVDVVKYAILRKQGKDKNVFKDYTKYARDPDILACFRNGNMWIFVYTNKEMIAVELTGWNDGPFFAEISGGIYSDLKEYCNAVRNPRNSDMPRDISRELSDLTSRRDLVGEDIRPPVVKKQK